MSRGSETYKPLTLVPEWPFPCESVIGWRSTSKDEHPTGLVSFVIPGASATDPGEGEKVGMFVSGNLKLMPKGLPRVSICEGQACGRASIFPTVSRGFKTVIPFGGLAFILSCQRQR